MNNQDVIRIIENYKPHIGFFNLSFKPSSLSNLEYAKILKLQNFVVSQNNNLIYLKEHNLTQWEKLKELCANLQQVIFSYWGNSVMEIAEEEKLIQHQFIF
jgi:hypothetical protein